MARMIPPVIGEDTASPGEREIFRRLRDEPGTHDWIVLHSLLIADHPTQVSGEADFVVIIPELGVLVLEVKACRSLRIEEGVWYYGWEPGDPRGPFRQASLAMHAIRRFVADARPDLDRVVFWSAVVFPYVRFDVRSEEWRPWQVIDGRRFRRGPLSKSLVRILLKAREHLAQVPAARWFTPDDAAPAASEAADLASLLRPRFEVIESPSARRRRVEAELNAYTEEQYEGLDAMAANTRVLFSGPAGTGKTLLALEASRRAARAGRHVLLVCFNRALARWLRLHVADFDGSISVETIASLMLKISGLDIRGQRPTPSFWREELPDLALDALIARSEDPQFDGLVVDEAQDLLLENYLDVLDLSLRGGLSSGPWRFFGDFERQAIFDTDISCERFLEQRGNGAAVHFLRTNCRNTPRIAALTYQLGGLRPDYRRIRRPDNGVEPDLRFYETEDEQAEMLCAALEQVIREGYAEDEIVVLSPVVDCAAARLGPPWRDRLRPLDQADPNHIGFTTVSAFKGLEAPVVLVSDLGELEGIRAQALFYVACTRPVERLTLLMHASLRDALARILSDLHAEARR